MSFYIPIEEEKLVLCVKTYNKQVFDEALKKYDEFLCMKEKIRNSYINIFRRKLKDIKIKDAKLLFDLYEIIYFFASNDIRFFDVELVYKYFIFEDKNYEIFNEANLPREYEKNEYKFI